ncbi:MAG: hypothetical protein QM756_04805 [Polyangiaceae bacterium]
MDATAPAASLTTLESGTGDTTVPSSEPPKFGDPGQVVLSGAFDLNLGRVAYNNTSANSSWINIGPSFDYFVSPNVSIGGWVTISYGSSQGFLASESIENSSLGYGAGARVGYNYPMGPLFSWWTRGGLSWWRRKFSNKGPEGAVTSANGTSVAFGDYDESVVTMSVTAPILLHPASHFFIGFGPELYLDLKHTIADFDNRRTYWGASSLVGGWF